MFRNRRRILCAGSLVWAAIGSVVAVTSLPTVDDDARVLVGCASIVFPLCAVAAAVVVQGRRFDRLAGLLLIASAATPTYFAYPLNVPALVVGLVLVTSPEVVLGRRTRLSSD
jgi:hypothetical protein